MIRREIGRSGITASAMSMGTWAIGGDEMWGASDEGESINAIRCAVENGIDIIDTAPAYGFGRSERIVGKALKRIRSDVKVITKCGLRFDGVGSLMRERDGKTVSIDLSAKAIISGLEQSLKNLKTDYVDILITHWQSRLPCYTPISETMNTMLELKRAGKIRGIGISNVTLDQIKEYMKHGQVDIVQMRYSMLTRDVESQILPFCEENGITLQAYSPLEQGLLTGNYPVEYVLPSTDVRNNTHWYQRELRIKVMAILDKWKIYCDKYDCNISSLVISWLIAQSDNINVLCGARKSRHILDNLKGGKLRLDNKIAKQMRRDILTLD
ncbi:MAG: aldo/keto reductase [Christensenellales bacterium]|jgi:methylglyoxal reductase